jgi:ribosomal-protein-alanine N-acetyltransferase
MDFFIETERLILRDLRDCDLNGMFELDSNPEVHKYLGNKPIKTIEESQEIIASVKQQYKERGIGRFAVVEKSSGNFIGWSGLRLYNEQESFNGFVNFYDIGYRLIPKYWRKGYATESSRASLDYAFKVLNLEIVYGITEMQNKASHNVLLKIGLNYIQDFYHQPLDENLRWYNIKKS